MHSKPYHRPYCWMMFKTGAHVKHHVRIYTGAKPHSCKHCFGTFCVVRTIKTTPVGQWESHNEDTRLTCNNCQKTFSHRRDLEANVRRHEGVKPCVCSECRIERNDYYSLFTVDVVNYEERLID